MNEQTKGVQADTRSQLMRTYNLDTAGDQIELMTAHTLYMYMYMYHFFLGKVTALGVLCCFALFVCLTLLASFFLPSHLSFKNMYMYVCKGQVHVHVYTCTLVY